MVDLKIKVYVIDHYQEEAEPDFSCISVFYNVIELPENYEKLIQKALYANYDF